MGVKVTLKLQSYTWLCICVRALGLSPRLEGFVLVTALMRGMYNPPDSLRHSLFMDRALISTFCLRGGFTRHCRYLIQHLLSN